jgi:hypothetical protein
MNHVRMRAALAAATIAALAFAATAAAVQTPIEDVDLEAAGGDAIFDPSNEADTCFTEADAYSPVEDGDAFGNSDGFDGGLILWVDGRPFVDANDEGDLVGEQLTVGPEAFPGVQITRVERGLPGSPTLRSLIKLKSTKKKAATINLSIDSDLGSDSSSEVRRTSSGDAFFSAKDRWVVTSDDADTPSDPPVTHIFNGKGKVTRLAHGLAGMEEECLVGGLNVKLPGKATRYVLIFTELSETNESAIAGATKFNKKKLSGALKSGLKKSVRKKVVNWDIAPKKKGKKNR